MSVLFNLASKLDNGKQKKPSHKDLTYKISIQRRITKYLKKISSMIKEALNSIKTLITELTEEYEINIMIFH